MNKERFKQLDRKIELNIGRFAIISIQSRVSSNAVRWELIYQIENRNFNIAVFTPEGRPHGIDSDVFAAIQTLFHQQGCPEHNWVHTSMYEVRELAGLHDNGPIYERIKEGLRRLFNTSFVAEEGWYDHSDKSRRWNLDTLRLFDRVKYRDQRMEIDEHLPGIQDTTTLSIKISDQVAQSIREQFTYTLDGRILNELEQPPSRALMRLLEAHRSQKDGSRLPRLHVNMQHWQVATGIMSERFDTARRVLQPAHDELIAANYLKEVIYHGRGKDQVIEYIFQPDDAPDHALVKLLEVHGLAPAIAARMARDHAGRIEDALKFVKQRKASKAPVKNQAGLIVDFLKNPDKYSSVQEVKDAVEPSTSKTLQQRMLKEEQQAENQQEQEHLRLLGLSPAEQYKECQSFFSVTIGRQLNKGEQDRLKTACVAGVLLAGELKAQLVQALAKNEKAAFVVELKNTLQKLPPPLFS